MMLQSTTQQAPKHVMVQMESSDGGKCSNACLECGRQVCTAAVCDLFDVCHHCSHLLLWLLQVWLLYEPAQVSQLVQQQPVLLIALAVICCNPDQL